MTFSAIKQRLRPAIESRYNPLALVGYAGRQLRDTTLEGMGALMGNPDQVAHTYFRNYYHRRFNEVTVGG
jgi:hypothetical protein